MKFLETRPAVVLRAHLRKAPRLQRRIATVLNNKNTVYEERLRGAMMNTIRTGDCVWDIGANLGYYSSQFLRAVGPNGTVVSVEPSPACVAALRDLRASSPACAAWHILEIAVSDRTGEGWLSIAEGQTAVDNRLVDTQDGSTMHVMVDTPDCIMESGRAGPVPPNVIKIDVEGSEEEVLRGMDSLLRQSDLRAIFIEIHFAILAKRGHLQAPTRIVRDLREAGFRVLWVDRSHLAALR